MGFDSIVLKICLPEKIICWMTNILASFVAGGDSIWKTGTSPVLFQT